MHFLLTRTWGLLLICASTANAQPDALLNWMDGQAQKLLDQRERRIASIQTKQEAEKHKASVRRKLLESIGGLPSYDGPLHARVTGRLMAGTHTIEKVIFESLPGFYITANVYKPNSPGKYPAVLIPAGHTQEGKPEPQIVAANLASKGFLALTYDPIGQGEREQTYLPQLGRALSGGGGNEHLELGARSILSGQSVARYFIFDAKRAVDYLVNRPDVDAERIAVTGCSGGGAIAAYAAVFDARFKAAAAGCFINSFRTMFTGPTADSEMSLPRFLANGMDMADLFESSAPLPWLMMATTGDYFTPDGARSVYQEVERWYSVYGARDRLQFFVGEGPHGTPKESREQIYKWMIRWLKDGNGDPTDKAVKLFNHHDLQVTDSGHVDQEPGSRKLWQIIDEEYRKNKKKRSVAEMVDALRKLGVSASGRAPSVETITQVNGKDFRTEQIRFDGEAGVRLNAKLYVPYGDGRKPAIVVVEEKRLPVPLFVQRSQSTEAVCEALAKAGQIVLELEQRDSPAANEGRPFLGNWVTNERADLIGRNLPAMRAHDILIAAGVLAARGDVEATAISGYARGAKGFWLLAAAAVDQRLRKIWLDRTPWSFEAGLGAPLMSHLFDVLIPGFALHWDFHDLVEALGTRRVFWTDPANWTNQVVFPGGPYRYRYVGESEDSLLAEFLR